MRITTSFAINKTMEADYVEEEVKHVKKVLTVNVYK